MRRAVLLILALCFLTSITSPGFSEKPLRLFFEKNIAVERQPGEEHVVKQGEWLFKILESKGYSSSEIQRLLPGIQSLNPHIPDMNRLMPGQVIQIPEISSQAAAVAVRPKPTKPPGSYEKMPYVVRAGDTLVQILQAQGVPTKLIFSQYMDLFLSLNPDVPDSNTLRVGQEIILPVTNRDEQAQPPAPPLPPAPKQAQTITAQPRPPAAAVSSQTGTPQAARQTASTPAAPAAQPASTPPRPQITPEVLPDSPSVSGSEGLTDGNNATATVNKNERVPRTGLPLVKTILEEMRFKFVPGDESMFPLPGSQWLIVKMQETPLVEAPWGEKILFCPVPKNAEWIQNANKLGMKVCTISPRWDLQEVLDKLATSFPKHFRLWGAGQDLVLSHNGVGVTLQSPQIAIMERGGQKRIHQVWTRQAPESAPLPQGLHEVLEAAQVRLIELDAYNEISRLPTRPRESIYVPVATHMELIRAMNPSDPEQTFGQTMPDSLGSLLQVLRDKDLLRQGMVNVSWSSGLQNRIAVQVPAWTVSGGTARIVILDRRFSDPYLVSVLSNEGYTCFVLPD
jgi:hypothetical protein